MSEYRRRLAALAAQYGRRVEMTKNHHYRLVAPGKPPVFASSTTSDPPRALKNIAADLKRMDKKQ